MLPDGSSIFPHDLSDKRRELDLYYTDPAQYIVTAGWVLDELL